MQITAVVNQKGGVGKTTTTINIGRALARVGRRVLLVDNDERGALTFHFLGPDGDDLASLYDVIGSHPQKTSLADAITSSEVEHIDVMPANEDLALLNNDLVFAGVGRESRLAKALAPVAEDYDDILIDCPPSLNLLTINALVASHQVLVITEPELYSGRGVGKLLDTIESVREQLNPLLRVAGVLINKYDKNEEIHVRRAVEIREQRTGGDPPVTVMPAVVPRWTTVMRTTDAGADVADFNHRQPEGCSASTNPSPASWTRACPNPSRWHRDPPLRRRLDDQPPAAYAGHAPPRRQARRPARWL